MLSMLPSGSNSLSALLRTDPSTTRGADRALTHAVNIGVWAFSELRYHVTSLQRGWESKIENHIARLPASGARLTVQPNKRLKLAARVDTE